MKSSEPVSLASLVNLTHTLSKTGSLQCCDWIQICSGDFSWYTDTVHTVPPSALVYRHSAYSPTLCSLIIAPAKLLMQPPHSPISNILAFRASKGVHNEGSEEMNKVKAGFLGQGPALGNKLLGSFPLLQVRQKKGGHLVVLHSKFGYNQCLKING